MSVWNVFVQTEKDTQIGAYAVWHFIDSFLVIGQSIIVFLIFGFSQNALNNMKEPCWKKRNNYESLKDDILVTTKLIDMIN